MYGSDARYIHSLGLLDDTTDQRVQPDLPGPISADLSVLRACDGQSC
jgi:hypothetical protein